MNEYTKSKNGFWREIFRRFKKRKSAVVGLAILVFFVLMAIFADVIAPEELALTQDDAIRLQAPSVEHLLGTDQFGRDVFARIVRGARTSLAISLITVLTGYSIGGFLGAAAGYFGGIFDMILMRIVDVFSCIPSMIMALAVITALGPSTINLMVAMIITIIPFTIRLVRSVIITVADQDFIQAAKSYSAGDVRIIIKYILPNALGPIIIDATMTIAGMILTASSLSYLGMGIQPPTPEWGYMLSQARVYLLKAPFLLFAPGLAIMITALSLNLIGDGFRDAFDPKLKDC